MVTAPASGKQRKRWRVANRRATDGVIADLLRRQGICSCFVLMPEPYWPKHQNAYLLSSAHANGSLLRIECRRCRVTRFFVPSDLARVFGDIEVDDVARKMRCEKCGEKWSMRISMELPMAAQRATMTIRRLDRIYHVKRVTWRDLVGG